MVSSVATDLCVIGAGSGGLAVAAGAVQMGARVVLIEKGKMGGDCLNYGCVPSKSLIAAGKVAQTVRTAGRFGVNGHEPEIDFLNVHDHVLGRRQAWTATTKPNLPGLCAPRSQEMNEPIRNSCAGRLASCVASPDARSCGAESTRRISCRRPCWRST